MRKREEQVAIQNAGKIEARKREDTLEQERVTAEKKSGWRKSAKIEKKIRGEGLRKNGRKMRK